MYMSMYVHVLYVEMNIYFFFFFFCKKTHSALEKSNNSEQKIENGTVLPLHFMINTPPITSFALLLFCFVVNLISN